MKRLWTLGTSLAALVVTALVVGTLLTPTAITEAQDGTLHYGDSVFGALDATAPTLRYAFAGTENDQVVVDVLRMSDELETQLTLYAPDGQELAQSEYDRLPPTGRNAHLAQVLPQNGTYTLEVRAAEGLAGNFMLRLQGRAQAVALEMQYGEPVTVNVPENAPPQYYTFETRRCATTLTVTNLAQGEPYTFPFALTVRNEQGQEIARLRGGVAHEDRVTVAAESGTYEVEVRTDAPTMAGMLSLLVTCAGQAPGCGGAGGETGAECPACPSCPEAWADGGETPAVCENVHVTATLLPATRGAQITWDAVPGADHYWIHMYGYAAGDETYLGPAGAPGDATSFTLDHLFPGFWGFRFVVEAVGADGSTLCVGQDEFMLADEETSCEDFHVTGEVLSNTDRTASWSWTAWPDTAFYVGVMSYDDAGGVPTWYSTSAYEAATTSITTTHPPAAETGDTWTLRVAAMNASDMLLCTDEATVTFESEIEHVVPYVCDITLLSPREGMTNGLQTFYWTPVDGATSYRVRVYDESGAVVAEGTVDAPATSLTLDVSTGVIGGGFTFHVAVEALRYGEHWCVDAVTELRAAENPGNGDNSGGNGNPQCYYLNAQADPSNAGYAAPLTAANCGNGYSAGTHVDVQAHPNSGCWLNYWDGCGASGNANPVTVTMTGNCTITAHLGCIQ